MIGKKVKGTYHGKIADFIGDLGPNEPIIAQVSGTDIMIINKKGFNDLTDLIAFEFIEDWDLGDIIHLASFVSELRRVLFDTDDKTEKEEN